MESGRTNLIAERYYRPSVLSEWQGRIDGTDDAQLRWHQHVQLLNLVDPASPSIEGSIVLLGFACDEGVKRNQGRVGAAEGPRAIRNALCNLPVHYPALKIYDAGDIRCIDRQLEAAQQQLAEAVAQILQQGGFPILLGGGHEITYGHYQGVRRFLNQGDSQAVGIVNFDAHFDNRELTAIGATSGTGFWQIAQQCNANNEALHYLALGIQRASNTRILFERAHQTNTQYVLAGSFHPIDQRLPEQLISAFSATVGYLYVTVDLDVFAAAHAPGVSAPACNGIMPDALFFNCLDRLFDSGKVLSLDIAELNPDFDIDNRTARLAASIIFHVVERLAENVF